MLTSVPFYAVDINGGFWQARQKLNAESTIPAVYARFSDTGRFDALLGSWRDGSDRRPHIFWDSDVAKWLEAAAYLLEKRPSPEIKAIVEDTIDRIENLQTRDGYINSYFTSVEPSKRWTNREWHELYCCGHLIEAAVAWKHATGDDRFENIMRRYADYIYRVFAEEESAAFATPGHEEIELALVKLYRSTGDSKYLELSRRFITLRGRNEKDPRPDTCHDYAFQDQSPVDEMTTAEGHSVRLSYLMSGAADIARECGDEKLLSACERVFDNIITRRMYITGGVGSTKFNEAFTADYDLPNAPAYTETCASIALAYFANRMAQLKPDSKYADTIEAVLYNGMLSGTSLDGRRFFYSNPMEINNTRRNGHPSSKEFDWLPAAQRVEVFSCSCCPPNVCRFIASVGEYMLSEGDDSVYLHQFMNAEAKLSCGSIRVETDYPESGIIHIRADIPDRKLYVRIPGWCRNFSLNTSYTIVNGYAVIEDPKDVTFSLDITPELTEAAPSVWDNCGKVCVRRGPVIYCAESIDNPELSSLMVSADSDFTEISLPGIPFTALKAKGYRREAGSWLYRALNKSLTETEINFIPYFCFANRGESDMKVWINVKL